MAGRDSAPGDAAELRRRADEIARRGAAESPENIEALSPEATRRMLHELRVHQIELEIQNEELRTAQVELDATRARYFDLYDLAPVGYATVSEQGLILEANLTAATLLDIPRRALVKLPITRFILKEDQDVYYLHHRTLFEAHSKDSATAPQRISKQDGGQQACELRMVKQDGTPFWAHLQTTLAQDADGAPECRMAINDVTDRKRAEEQVNQLQKAESLGRMAGALAHRFNNLLSVVMMNLEVAIETMPPDVGHLEELNSAMQAAGKAAEVSGSMLAYLGQAISTREPLDLSAFCRRYLPMIQAALPDGIILETDLPSPGPTVRGDANQLRQVLTNLIANAWEAVAESSGTIHLAVRTASPPDISATNRFPIDWQPEDKTYACLEVRDNGCGIADGDIGQIFDPFFSTKFIGRGLGLPVVLGVVRAYRGSLTVASHVGSQRTEESRDGAVRGSVFQVFLPEDA